MDLREGSISFKANPISHQSSAITPLSNSCLTLNGRKPKYMLKEKKLSTLVANNICKYINTKTIPSLPVTQEALICT
jgi:hypothetical protein